MQLLADCCELPFMARRAPELAITEQERIALKNLFAEPRNSVSHLRAAIILMAAEGKANDQISRRLRTTTATVGKWRRRFIQQRLAGLTDGLRSGRPRKLGPIMERSIVRARQRSTGMRRTFSYRQVAKNFGIAKSNIQQICARHGHSRTLAGPGRSGPLKPEERWGDLAQLHVSNRFWLVVTSCSDPSWTWEEGHEIEASEAAKLCWRLAAVADLLSRRLTGLNMKEFFRDVFVPIRDTVFRKGPANCCWQVLLLGGTQAMVREFLKQGGQRCHVRCYYRPRHLPCAELLHSFLTTQFSAFKAPGSWNSVAEGEEGLIKRISQGPRRPDVYSWIASPFRGNPCEEASEQRF